MALEFTEIWQNVMDEWETLFKAELTPIPIYQSDVWESAGVEALRLSDGESDLIGDEGLLALGETRTYSAVLTYYLTMKPGKVRQQQLRKAFNRINAVINRNRASAGDYVYHDFQSLDASINDEPLEGEPDLQTTGNVRMTIQATVTEAIA